MSTETTATEPTATPRWQPLEGLDRRVLGVLVEKAKTTPENYPLSLNSLKSGCNQKNNRSPLMQVEEEQVESALESLRKVGAVVVIQGNGRVEKFRHLAYDWLGVDKVELAVMAELLLRGTQTVGELRGRAARMEPIKDMGELRPVLDSLVAKGLVQFLTPEGRGAVVTHTLYLDREMDKVRREAALLSTADGGAEVSSAPAAPVRPSMPMPTPTPAAPRPVVASSATIAHPGTSNIGPEFSKLREEIATLKREFEAARSEFESTTQELRRELDELNRQLGN
jgi:uncharacterized protein YceH (UPF0502 family)